MPDGKGVSLNCVFVCVGAEEGGGRKDEKPEKALQGGIGNYVLSPGRYHLHHRTVCSLGWQF